MRIRFLTSTPLDIQRGSGTFVGIQVLATALRALGHEVRAETPRLRLPVYTLERAAFNRGLRADASFDLTVGFDMDGYLVAGRGPSHVAALKGVIADEARFERGLTRITMSMQASRERLHTHRADRVIATSRYSAAQAQGLYQLDRTPLVVPELIDLRQWRQVLEANAAPASRAGFAVLYVGRLYRRKRVEVLLQAAARLRERIPGLEVRIVGNGPCAARLRALGGELRLENTVTWLGDVSRARLAAEYNGCDVFCLPSVQEGFGIVLLEAMAAAKPVVASRAGAIPEVAPHGVLVEPENPEALAEGLESIWLNHDRREALGAKGLSWVEQFDAARVARLFLAAATGGPCSL